MRLYDIADQIEQVLAAGIDRETGEIPDECMAALDELEMERSAKCLALGAYIKGVRAESEAVKVESKKLAARAKVHDNQAERLINYLRDNMSKDAEKISDARTVIAWRQNPARVEIDVMTADIPHDLCTYVPEAWKPDKAAIKKALSEGRELRGVAMKKSSRLEIK